MFITDAIMNGLPPHIAQVIAGHNDINTTMHYNAVYPSAAIAAHQAFIAWRRSRRPGEEYRVLTSEEWEAFLGHFERRKLSLGTCGRSFGSDCVHEHASVRCAMLRVDPHERPRLEEIRVNLIARIAEAEREDWLARSTGSASASPPRTSSPSSTPKSPADPPWSTSACPPSARSPPDPPHPPSSEKMVSARR